MAMAQLAMQAARADSKNPHFKSSYADITSVLDAIKEPLGKNQIAVFQIPWDDDTGTYCITLLVHSSGQYIGSKLKLVFLKQDMQSKGGALTYAKRYSLTSLVGLGEKDDDGESLMDRGNTQKAIEHKPQPKPQPINPGITEADKARFKKNFKETGRSWTSVVAMMEQQFQKSKLEQLTLEEFDKLDHILATEAIAITGKV
jgi:hypothetical protein